MARSGARKRLGDLGERLAAEYLEAHGYRVLARNWRCVGGEVDIVAEDASGLAFVEVKTRRGRTYGTPEEALVPTKIRRLETAAQAWLAAHVGDQPVDWRIDVVAVEFSPAGTLLRLELHRYALV
ncbi:MAG: YraN family protein [Ardenticatenaceae bacterium]|nr:YraN family protein [Ardenticatenaceae bacterium]